MADVFRRLGDVPPDRVRFRPFPGTATVQDVADIHRREGRLCELVDGVLLEKPVAFRESRLAVYLAGLLNAFVIPRNLGIVSGPDGTVEVSPDLVRIPDVAFISWDRVPGRRSPDIPVPALVPDLAVEVLSRGNTEREMALKRQEYFAAGVRLVWEIDPEARTVTVYSSPSQSVVLSGPDSLSGEAVRPGFSLPLVQLFAELDREG